MKRPSTNFLQHLRPVAGLAAAVHPFPVTVVVSASACLVVIAHHGLPKPDIFSRIVCTVLLSQLAVGALNDVVDRHSDSLTQPWKPIPSGRVRVEAVILLTILSLVGCTILAATFGSTSFVLVCAGTGGGIAYDLWLKPTPWSFAGYLVGFLTLVTWIYATVGHIAPSFLLVYPAGSLLLVAAHLANSFPDMETDSSLGSRGLSVVIGAARTNTVVRWTFMVVAFPAALIAALHHSPVALFLIVLSGVVGVTGLVLGRGAAGDRKSRLLLFRFISPSIACLGAGCMVLISYG